MLLLRTKMFCFLLSLFLCLSLSSLNRIFASESESESDSDSDSVGKLNKNLKKTKISKPVTLVRCNDTNDTRLVEYSQELVTKGEELPLSRKSTKKNIQYVREKSKNDGGKTHLIAQAVYMTDSNVKSNYLTTSLGFPGIPIGSKIMEWVSHKSNPQPNENYYIRKPVFNYDGGHGEVQFIYDIETTFNYKKRDPIINLFLPSSQNPTDIYSCGFELFGPYDMCDADAGKSNQYDCIGQLKNFRERQQRGQQSISQYIRDKLGGKFKGNPEDAFVLIYHAQYPYHNNYTYRAEDNQYYYPLNFKFDQYQFYQEETWDEDFDNSYKLSQKKSLKLQPDMIYSYIHQLAGREVPYNSITHSFSL